MLSKAISIGSQSLLILGPEPPRMLDAIVGTHSVTIQWEPVKDGCHFYEIVCLKLSQDQMELQTNECKRKFSDLSPGSEYEFTVNSVCKFSMQQIRSTASNQKVTTGKYPTSRRVVKSTHSELK